MGTTGEAAQRMKIPQLLSRLGGRRRSPELPSRVVNWPQSLPPVFSEAEHAEIEARFAQQLAAGFTLTLAMQRAFDAPPLNLRSEGTSEAASPPKAAHLPLPGGRGTSQAAYAADEYRRWQAGAHIAVLRALGLPAAAARLEWACEVYDAAREWPDPHQGRFRAASIDSEFVDDPVSKAVEEASGMRWPHRQTWGPFTLWAGDSPRTWQLQVTSDSVPEEVFAVLREHGLDDAMYAWDEVARRLVARHAPEMNDRLEYDSECDMFATRGDQEGLVKLSELLFPVVTDSVALTRELTAR